MRWIFSHYASWLDSGIRIKRHSTWRRLYPYEGSRYGMVFPILRWTRASSHERKSSVILDFGWWLTLRNARWTIWISCHRSLLRCCRICGKSRLSRAGSSQHIQGDALGWHGCRRSLHLGMVPCVCRPLQEEYLCKWRWQAADSSLPSRWLERASTGNFQ